MHMNVQGSKSSLSRSVSAEVRARMAARRISGKSLAGQVGMSQNYLATRLRDEKPFTLDDVDALVSFFDEGEDFWEFVHSAQDNHYERIMEDMCAEELEDADRVSMDDYVLAARDTDDDEIVEAQQEMP